MCTNATCTMAEAPICDVDAGMCVACATDGDCVGKGHDDARVRKR